ncbi:MAG: protein jag [Actinomycetota bacterium]|nr:protein jag [Actinomycetota bacterium]
MRSDSRDYSGKTVEEAVQTALEELGVRREDVSIEIVEEPQKSFFGIGGKEARIRVELIQGEESGGSDKESPAEQILGTPDEILRKIIEIFEFDAVIDSKETLDETSLEVWGDNLALLIGKGGSTLDALDFLVNVCARKRGVRKRVTVDIEGYRKRRNSRIEKEAIELAKRALAEGKTLEMPATGSANRRIAHIAIRSVEGVWSESVGEEPQRRVVVHPKNEKSFT